MIFQQSVYKKRLMNYFFRKSIFLLLIATVLVFSSCSLLKRQPKAKVLTDNEWLEYNNALVEGNKNKMLGSIADAAANYQMCMKINPTAAAPYFEIANIYLGQGDWVKSLKFSEHACKLEPNNIWYNVQLANLYQKNGMLMKSADVFKRLITLEKDKIDFYYNLASIYTAVGKIKDAIKTLDEAEKKFGVSEIISMEKERLYMLDGKPEKSVVEIEKLVKAFPNDTRFMGILAETYTANRMLDKALETYKKVLAIDNNNGIAHLSLSDFYRLTGDDEKSFSEMKIAFASPDVDIDLKIKTLMSYINFTEENAQLKSRALILLDTLLAIHPDDPKVHTMNADFLIRDKKYKEARDALRLVVKQTKDKFMIWEQLLYLESQISDYAGMLEESREVIDLFPSQPTAFLFNGLAALELKDYKTAVESLKKGLWLVIDNNELKIQFLTYLGEAYNKNKQIKESDETFDKLLKIDPKNTLVLNNYSYYLSIRGDSLEKAERMIKKVIEAEPNSPTYLDTYAWVLYKLEKFEDAKKVMEKALEKDSYKSAVLLEHYGDILYKFGQKEEAWNTWKKAKEAGKGSEFLDQKINEKKLIE